MPEWVTGDQGLVGIIGAITGLIGVFFGYKIKKSKNDQTLNDSLWHKSETHWESILEDNEKFRKEIKEDLEKVKKERDSVFTRLRELEVSFNELMRENLEMKKREIVLEHQIDDLKRENTELKNLLRENENYRCKLAGSCEDKDKVG